MLSYQQQYELAQSLASDSSSTNLTLFQNLINVGIHKIERKLDIFVTEQEKTLTTVTDAVTGTSSQAYYLPRGFVSLSDFYVTIGTTQYHIKHLIEDPVWWGQITGSTTQQTSNYVEYARIKGRKIWLWPIPSSAQTATIVYYGTSKDLSQADYTTGSILTLANAGTAVTGSGTTWTSQMVGRGFKINDNAEWHFIKSFTSTTSIALETPYQGAAISSGSATYTIGEMCSLPEDIHDLPVTWALWQWFAFYHRDKFLANMYKSQYDEGIQDAQMEYSTSGSGVIIQGRTDGNSFPVNPNWYPSGMS